ncbi:hypothetical protein [Telmatospirillum siberiense]|uniref:Uncharacterized protein n=1 Tax=Telmatospirillum siberiense TaxID=382514 RepID=A0A2N3PW75_9PROT|nr:hypothetical protein [Telmatospirillum siberiense]PKU24652.1 hypothetical protein CWS72_09900 [Telmatospirillum siberiense]
MMGSVSTSFLGSEFNDFLFASVGEDRNEMPLSVISVLARLDLDPWQEAAQLARSPPQTAIQRLASLIEKLPEGLSTDDGPGPNAARLIALLPRQTGPNMTPGETSFGIVVADKSRDVGYLLAMLFVLGAFFVMASGQPPEKLHISEAETSGAAQPFDSLPNSIVAP